MKLLYNIFVLCIVSAFMSCSSSDNEEIVHKLQPVDYSDLHRYIGTDKDAERLRYDTIIVNKSAIMLDTLKKYLSTEIQTTLASANKIAFSFLQDNKMKYVDYSWGQQIIADRFDSTDSIYVLRYNNLADSIFVARNKGELSNDYFRTISAYRLKYNSEDKQEVIEGEILELNILLKKLNLNSINDLKKGDYLLWTNVYYRYR